MKRTVSELLSEIDESYLSGFENPIALDESTVRKKLKEYCEAGILACEKEGKKVYYHRTEITDLSDTEDALHYFSEAAPCGVIGSFLLDKINRETGIFTFKHHYITGTMDSGVLTALFSAMREKRVITVTNCSQQKNISGNIRLIPLRIFISAQNGRQHLIAYVPTKNRFSSYRLDYLSNVVQNEPTPRFDELRAELDRMQSKIWGVSVKKASVRTDHVEFTVKIEEGEDYIVQRLKREKRIGTVEALDRYTYRFSADVYDTSELIPWIRTFICRIVQIDFSDKAKENQFKADLKEMYRMYGIGEEEAK